jgi:polar amino acid transport system substrate-binding protein
MDVDIANLLAQSLGAKLQIVNVPEATRIAEIQAGKVDVLFSSPAITDARAQVVAFTQPYIAAGTVLVTLKSSGIKNAADMAGKKLGLLAGTFYVPIAKADLPKSPTQTFASTTDETVALKDHLISAYFRDSNTAAFAAKADPTLSIVNGNFGPVEYDGFAVQQNQQIWLNYLNTFIFNIEENGTLLAEFEHWFGSPPLYSPILTQLGSAT